MSRTLDEDVAASLSAGSAEAAYDAISRALSPREDGGLQEIEILGSSHEMPRGVYVVRDGSAIGVSKLGLVQAFVIARQIFMAGAAGPGRAPETKLLAATAVILLLDPEHLTAANTRKRLMQEALSCRLELDDISRRVRMEKQVIDSLLTGRLHRHTKSPTLWSHRRWLISLCRSQGLSVDALGDMAEVVLVAGERHSRNYYAWSHARWLVSLVAKVARNQVVSDVKNWCLRHRDDISGWSFLIFLLTKQGYCETDVAREVFGEVLEVTTNLRWTNESVWVFLQALASLGVLGAQEVITFERACTELVQYTHNPRGRLRIEASISWCQSHCGRDRAQSS